MIPIFFIVILPICVFVSPSYWQGLNNAPIFYLGCFYCFVTPILVIASNKSWRNPFFLVPFTCSFIIASLGQNYEIFTKNMLLFIGFSAVFFGLSRTPPSWVGTELRLNATGVWTSFFEIRNYWRICVVLFSWVYLPVWIVLAYFGVLYFALL